MLADVIKELRLDRTREQHPLEDAPEVIAAFRMLIAELLEIVRRARQLAPDTETIAAVGGNQVSVEREELLTLQEAVELLRGTYARRTLQNYARSGRIRSIGRGEGLLFDRSMLLADLLGPRSIEGKEQEGDQGQGEDDSAHRTK